MKYWMSPPTVQGQSFTLSLEGGPSITDARGRKANIVATNVQASNGVIHVIDKVILPKAEVPPAPTPNIVLPAKLLAKDITDGAMPTTVQGQKFTVDKDAKSLQIRDARSREANVIATDVQAVNGVIHLIDKVLLPKP